MATKKALSGFENMRNQVEKFLYEKNAFTDVLEVLEKRTKVKRLYLFSGVAAFLSLYLIFGYGADLICNSLGFIYPAYCSIKAIESDRKDDDTQWLTYWVVYGSFIICEFFTDILLSWFPLYFLVKLLFLGWCMAPISWNGSQMIYSKIIRPFFIRHEVTFDSLMDKAKEKVAGAVDEAKKIAHDNAGKIASAGFETMSSLNDGDNRDKSE